MALKGLGPFKRVTMGKREESVKLYEAECEFCGKIVFVRKYRLNKNESCGCHKKVVFKNFRNGSLFYAGIFMAAKEDRGHKYKQRQHLATCDCGNTLYVPTCQVRDKKSCGCRKYIDRPRRFTGGRSKYFVTAYLKLVRLGAVDRDIEFAISLSDLDDLYERQNGECIFTREKLTLPQNGIDCSKNKTSYNISVDRIDSSKGYLPDNIQLTTKKINRMKSDMSDSQFIELCKLVADVAATKC